jgi:hypothetical protein
MSIWWWITEDLANSDIGIWGLENDGVIMVGSVPCKLLPEADEHNHRGEKQERANHDHGCRSSRILSPSWQEIMGPGYTPGLITKQHNPQGEINPDSRASSCAPHRGELVGGHATE